MLFLLLYIFSKKLYGFVFSTYIKLFWRFWHSCVIAPDFDGLDSTSYKAQSLSWKLVEKKIIFRDHYFLYSHLDHRIRLNLHASDHTCTHFFFFNSDSKGPLLGRLSTKGQLRTNQPAIAMMSTFTPYTQQEMNALLKTAETYLCTSSYVH